MTKINKNSIETEVIHLQKVDSFDFGGYENSGQNEYGSYPRTLEDFMDPHIDSVRRLDIQRFIFSLSFNEVATILFLSMGFKRKEIHELLGYKRVQNLNQIVSRIRRLYQDEQF